VEIQEIEVSTDYSDSSESKLSSDSDFHAEAAVNESPTKVTGVHQSPRLNEKNNASIPSNCKTSGSQDSNMETDSSQLSINRSSSVYNNHYDSENSSVSSHMASRHARGTYFPRTSKLIH